MDQNLKTIIEQAWDQCEQVQHNLDFQHAVNQTIDQLNQGLIRVAQYQNDKWHVDAWIKKAILLSFRLYPNTLNDHHGPAYDKIPLKFINWSQQQFFDQGIRCVPGAVVRKGSYIGRNVVLMPSFINIGAYVGDNTMIDTWATVGSCAQVGSHCHISGGTGLGGVLEPLQANPVIIEDNCFIGARSEIVEGVIVKQGAVIGMGVFIGANTPIYNAKTGETHYGEVPPYSVVIAGSMPMKKAIPDQNIHLNCAVIIKTVDEKTRSKTAINELLRP